MKKTLLVVLSLFAIAGLEAQTTVETYDITYLSTTSEPLLKIETTTFRVYDSACRVVSLTYSDYDYTTQQVTYQTRYLNEYDADGNLHRQTAQRNASGTFENDSRNTYRFFPSGIESSQIEEIWDGSQWAPLAFDSFNYDNSGAETYRLEQRWDDSSRMYINNVQETYGYNVRGYPTFYLREQWNPYAMTWYPTNEELYVYNDGTGYPSSDTIKAVNAGTGIFGNDSYTTYYRNSAGQSDSIIQVYLPDNNYDKTYITYQPGSALKEQVITSYSYTGNGTLAGGYRNRFFDSTYPFVQYDSVAAENLVDSASGAYSLNYTYYSRNTYNPDSTIHKYEYSYAFYSRGVLYSSSYYDNVYTYASCAAALPVTLLSFTANKKDNNAVLQWKTANEINTSSFHVQRSTDGVHFTTIGSLKAAGNSSGERSYVYTDYNINTLGVNKLYYRLAQQDVNGSVHNSTIAQIDLTNSKLSVTLSPNPVRNSIGIYSPVAMQNAVIRIADMSGKVVYASRTNLSAGTVFSINASAFAKGVYFVTVQSGTDKQVLKLVKE